MLAPGTVIPSDDASNTRYSLKGVSIQVESVSFGDGSYRAMVDQRTATRQPLMVPYKLGRLWKLDTGHQHKPTIQLLELSPLMLFWRPSGLVTMTALSFSLPMQSEALLRRLVQLSAMLTGSSLSRQVATHLVQVCLFQCPTTRYTHGITFSSQERSQFLINSVPWAHGALISSWTSTRNCTLSFWQMFRMHGTSLATCLMPMLLLWHTVLVFNRWISFHRHSSCSVLGLDHHSDDVGKDHLISGLNTTGSLIPTTFSANLNTMDSQWNMNLIKMCGGNLRPTVFTNMTSTLMIYVDRTISVVNWFSEVWVRVRLSHQQLQSKSKEKAGSRSDTQKGRQQDSKATLHQATAGQPGVPPSLPSESDGDMTVHTVPCRRFEHAALLS